jgi:hypothetical protein
VLAPFHPDWSLLIFEVVPFKLTSFREGPFAMNDTTSDLDQTDEDILTYEVSDEALEAVSGTGHSTSWSTCRFGNPGCVGA